MTKSLLEVLVANYSVQIGIVLILAAITLRPAKRESWSPYSWLPLFGLSLSLSLPVLTGCLSGIYGVPLALDYWPFPIAAVLFYFAKPEKNAFGIRALTGVLVLAALALGLFLIPTSHRKFVMQKAEPAARANGHVCHASC